jgi:hypothetical protein
MTKRSGIVPCSVLAFALAPKVWAIAPPEPDFPMVGGSLGQTIQLNIRAVGDPQILAPRCQAILSFRDSNNLPVGTSLTVDLGPDQGTFLTLSFNRLVSRLGQRFELQPVVTAVNREVNFACQASVEIYESISGRTIAWIAPPEPDAQRYLLRRTFRR